VPRPGGYDVSLVTSGHDVADARLHRLVAALTDSGLTVDRDDVIPRLHPRLVSR